MKLRKPLFLSALFLSASSMEALAQAPAGWTCPMLMNHGNEADRLNKKILYAPAGQEASMEDRSAFDASCRVLLRVQTAEEFESFRKKCTSRFLPTAEQDAYRRGANACANQVKYKSHFTF